MDRVRQLAAKASEDLELAKRYQRLKEYATATLLYNSAVEKMLKALVMVRTKKSPPSNASIGYLAQKAHMPDYISNDIMYLQKSQADPVEAMGELELREEEGFVDHSRIESRLVRMDSVARRLMDYFVAYVKA